MPLAPSLSPLVPREEREKISGGCIKKPQSCTANPLVWPRQMAILHHQMNRFLEYEPRSTYLPSLVSQDYNNRGRRRGPGWLAMRSLARCRAGLPITRLG